MSVVTMESLSRVMGGQTWTAGAGLSRGGPLIVSSSYPGPAYTAREHVYRTTEGGSTWQVRFHLAGVGKEATCLMKSG
jgi:hypothetical protein